MKAKKKKEKTLKISLSTVRFDKVPKSVISVCLNRSSVQQGKVILDYEYSIRRNLDVDFFSRKFSVDLDGWLGAEIRRLSKYGLHPVLYIGFCSNVLDCFFAHVGEKTVEKMSRRGGSMRFLFDTENDKGKQRQVISLPETLISMLAKFHFSLELS